ncbi:endo-alpha-N-acetylgalactosaminidase [Arthrobacter alpinus]|uniref:Endo-alpha-N-acetylgalactosaminidase n=1 Tax=Arthrobacter alpinus TaxID=656366 RepID=A0A1H5K6P3_9MICC|nr:endo-alpha-N-acetylgalactosaminidase family protein [Arthrobacter alpinus]SEE60399.1 endo-alpha-N-acetylgalactosaminidase [Arthrobacter alpinus]
MSFTRHHRTWLGMGIAGAVMAGTIIPLAAAIPAIAANGTEVITSGELSVEVSTAFPQALKYTLADAGTPKIMTGATEVATKMRINGVDQAVTVTSTVSADKTSIAYDITVPGMAGVTMKAKLSVEKNVLAFNITEIKEIGDAKVNRIQIMDQDLVTVSSTEAGASVATAVVSTDRAISGDKITPITAGTAVDAAAQTSMVAIANNAGLAAGFESNSLYDGAWSSEDNALAASERGRFWRQVKGDGADKKVGISSGAWLYRAKGSTETEPLPEAKVIITGDANADGTINWQDGAIASRDIQYKPKGWEDVKNRVVQNIPFNFASQASNPFLRTLDDVKHTALATDGLGQYSLLKGFTSEGHDSANTDFSGNWNERAGGIKDMNTLLSQAKEYGATFTVHMNNTEAYPESKAFSDTFIKQPPGKGWNWLEQSYYIDQRRDVLSGDQNQRIKGLDEAADDNLTANYIDVYYESGWVGERLQRNIMDNGFSVSSEFANSMVRNNTWSHWAVDEKYGGSTLKGWNSEILRFAQNTQRDIWNPDPRLGTQHIIEWQGWTGQNDFNAFIKNVWDNNVPVKFLQQQEIKTWTPEAITLENEMRVTGTSLEDRVITQKGVEVLKGHNYLLPWSSDAVEFGETASNDTNKQTKLYNYSLKGGAQTWTLLPEFANQTTLKLYELTDQGRSFVSDVAVTGGKVNLAPKAATAYVLVPTTALASVPAVTAVDTVVSNADTDWGNGTGIKDPGFNAGNLSAWNAAGNVTLARSAKGLTAARFGDGAASITQTLDALDKGTYSVSAWIEIDPALDSAEKFPRGKRDTTVSATVPGSAAATNTINSSSLFNTVAGDQKNRTFTQRVSVLVDVKNDGDKPVLTISAGAGATAVLVDDIRVVKTARVTADQVGQGGATGVVTAEDFENVDQGWGPFVKGNAGGNTDPRTHLAPIHAPFTQKGWNGKVMDDVLNGGFSLHAHEENGGLVYRTTPATVKFTPGHDYEISFNYQSTKANEYSWVGGYDGAAGAVQTQSTPFPAMHETTRWKQNFTASACGDSYVGLLRTGSTAADLSLDNLLIRDLGASTNAPACAQLSLAQTGPIIEQGTGNEFTTTLVSNEPAPVSNAAVSLKLPEGWTATAKTPATAATLAPGAKLITTWNVVAPASADGNYNITANSVYSTTIDPIGVRKAESTLGVYTMPHPPVKDTYASDMQWIGTPANGWGPAEKDLTNGEQGEKDGPAIMLDGKAYAKGLGVHAASNIKYFVGAQCTAFTAVIGIDDFQATRGSVIFKVLGDGVELFNSGVLTGSSPAMPINVDLKGAKYVELVVDPNGNNGNDWADWADAMFRCSDESPALALTPVVNPGGPLERGTDFSVTVGELTAGTEATFSLGTAKLGTATASAEGVATFSSKVAADAAMGAATITVAGTDVNGKAATGSVTVSIVGTHPAAPTADTFASDMEFVGTPTNEWGPVERDQNNGENAEGDGAPITIDTNVYEKGLGVHADSSVRFYLGGQCATFSAVVGIDDAKLPKAHRGNVVFTVEGDGKTLATSPQLTVDDEGYALNVDVTGIRYIDLDVAKVKVGGLNGDEWADWADAKFSCADETPALVLAPAVEGGNAVEQGASYTVTVADLQGGSPATLQLADAEELSAVANADGVATFTLVVPENAAVGAAALTATGTDKFGKAATGTTTISVTAKPVEPSEPGFTPEAPNLKSLKKDTQIDLGLGSKKFQRGPSEVTLANLAAGKWFYVYLNGDGLGWHQALPDGTIEVNTPESTRPGDNKFVLFNEAGSLHGWAALKVTGPPVK